MTQVSTTVRRERTPQGVGPGARERLLRRTFPSLRCERLPPTGVALRYVSHSRDCTLFSASGTRTIFRTAVDSNYGVTAAEFVRKAVVTEVVIAAR